MSPLTERQRMILEVLAGSPRPMTANALGHALGFRTGSDRPAHDGRVMGPANRVIGSLTGLRRRGLVDFGPRPDGLSGTAYRLTPAGRIAEPQWRRPR